MKWWVNQTFRKLFQLARSYGVRVRRVSVHPREDGVVYSIRKGTDAR